MESIGALLFKTKDFVSQCFVKALDAYIWDMSVFFVEKCEKILSLFQQKYQCSWGLSPKTLNKLMS